MWLAIVSLLYAVITVDEIALLIVVAIDTQVIVPNHGSLYAIFNVTNCYNVYYLEMLSHGEFLHVGVASVQATIDQARHPDSKPSRAVLQHVGKALSNLRRKINQPGATADDMTIMTVLFLAVITVCPCGLFQ